MNNKFLNKMLIWGISLKLLFWSIYFISLYFLEHKDVQFPKPERFNNINNIIQLIFVLGAYPILEEFVFRWHLTKNKSTKKYKIKLTSIAVILLAVFFLQLNLFRWIIAIPLIISYIFLFFSPFKSSSKTILWQIVLSTISFAFIHKLIITNGFNPILIMPYIGAGLLYSALRIKYGYLIAVLAHLSYNIIVLSPKWASSLDIEHHKIDYKETTIQYWESGRFNIKESSLTGDNSILISDGNLIESLKLYFESDQINPRFKFANHITPEASVKLLENYKQIKSFRVYNLYILNSNNITFQELLDILVKEKLVAKVK